MTESQVQTHDDYWTVKTVDGKEHRPCCLPSMLDRIFEPADGSVIMFSGEGGSGKTLSMIEIEYLLVTKLHRYVLTNDLFLQKVKGGWRELPIPHERVRTVKNMRDFWMAYANIVKADPWAIVIPVLDEWHKYMRRLAWFDKIVLATMAWWSENRKFRTVPTVITQQMRQIPRQLLPYVKWYFAKSRELTSAYNHARGSNYGVQQLAFLIRIMREDELEKRTEIEFTLEDVVQVFLVERGPWTGDLNTAKIGQICYDPMSSATFTMGEVRGTEDWFDKFMDHISGCPSMMVADKILEFFEEGTNVVSRLDRVPNAEIGVHVYRQSKAKMLPEQVEEYPVYKAKVRGFKELVEIERNPANLAREFDISERSMRRAIEKEEKRTLMHQLVAVQQARGQQVK